MIARRNAPQIGTITADASASRNGFDRFSWDNLRLFLAVAEAGSFRSAAVLAGVSINTIRTKVERLERQIGGPLLRRSVEGVALTQDGRELLQIAREMRELGRTTARVSEGGALRGAAVRLVVTEGLGTVWLLPRLMASQAASPDVRLSISCNMNSADVLFRDIDLSVQLMRPSDPMLVVEQIATLHLAPFATDAYLDRHGMPGSLADLKNHRLAWQSGDAESATALQATLDEESRAAAIAIETNTSTGHYWAVANGAGIGFLPTYARALNPDLRLVDLGIVVRRPLFVAHREDSLECPRVAAVFGWLQQALDPQAYPFFGDEFVHPESIKVENDGRFVRLFGGAPA